MNSPHPAQEPAPTDESADVQPGRYLHFKGNHYEVLHVARHCDTQQYFVVYKALYGEEGLWIRSLRDFTAIVDRDGVCQPRFKRV